MTTATETRPPSAANLSRVPYLPGLDGMRALAVVAVMVYHASAAWLPGGFLGVDVFFVISGYLITLLLMAERESTGGVDLVAFWIRRARRLLPALFVMLFLLVTYTWIFRNDALGQLRGDTIAGIFYSSNWYQIWVGQGYSAAGDFAPLRHLWSLAVEEQFYLVWPIVMLLLMRRNGTRHLTSTARWLVLGAIGVTVITAMLYHPGRYAGCDVTPEAYWQVGERCIAKADALYLSTITRSSGLMLGAAFAMVWRPIAIMRSPLRRAGRAIDLVAVAGLAVLAFLVWNLSFMTPAGADPWLFRGGFFVAGVATLAVIAGVTHPRTVTSRVLGMRPLVWVGMRSYGLYLFHWPIYQVIRKVAGNPLTVNQFLAAMVVTVIITEASYRFVEMPIRRRQFGAWWETMRRRNHFGARRLVAATAAAVVLIATIGALQLGFAPLKQNEIAAALDANQGNVTSLEDLVGGGEAAAQAAPEDAPATATTLPPDPDAIEVPASTTTTTTTTTTTLPAEPVSYLAIGDSVMLGAANELTERGYVVDAQESRQLVDMIPLMEQLGEADLFGDPVIIHLGTNGPITREALDRFLAPLSGVPNVIMFNVRANRAWTAQNNAILADRNSPNDNIFFVDWNARSQECVGNCFAADGIHLSSDGVEFYADLISEITGR